MYSAHSVCQDRADVTQGVTGTILDITRSVMSTISGGTRNVTSTRLPNAGAAFMPRLHCRWADVLDDPRKRKGAPIIAEFITHCPFPASTSQQFAASLGLYNPARWENRGWSMVDRGGRRKGEGGGRKGKTVGEGSGQGDKVILKPRAMWLRVSASRRLAYLPSPSLNLPFAFCTFHFGNSLAA